MSLPRASQAKLPYLPLIMAALMCAVQLILTFPGTYFVDSEVQLAQALSRHYGDWHPPVMAFVWSYLIKTTGSQGALLVLHQGLFWLGLGLLADGCYRAGMVKRAWMILAAGAFPFFLIYGKILLKDVGMASAFVAALGMAFWFLIQSRVIPWWIYPLAGVCLLYGVLIRTNAVFVLGQLVYVYAAGGRQFKLAKILGCSLLVAAIAIPLSGWINHRVIGAKPQDPLQSLQIFDLMGIAVHAGDDRVWGENPPQLSSIQRCYTPYWWDTFASWRSDLPVCPEVRSQIGAPEDVDNVDQDNVRLRSQLWRNAIALHPLAYAAHRLSHFNSSIYFLVPALHFRYVLGNWLHPDERDIQLDYLKRNFLLWPVFWLAVALGCIATLGLRTEASVAVNIAKLLMTSGLIYSLTYLLFGVATDYRYYYWSVLVILLGVILANDELQKSFTERPWRGRLAVTCVLLVLVGGYAARILLGRIL